MSEERKNSEDNNAELLGVNLERNLSLENEPKGDKQKIDILLKPTGNAPIMKKKKWSVDSDKRIGWITEFVKKYIKLEPHERLFMYVNQTFAPSPDQTLKNLYDCYSSEGKVLVLHYCKTQAWG